MPTLRSRYFAPSQRLQQAAGGGRPLAQGESSSGVALLQAGLCDCGYRLPRSTRPNGSLDGVFGSETATQLRSYQATKPLKPDGIAGPRTLGAMDMDLMAKQGASPPSTPPPVIPKPKQPPPPNVPVNIDDLNYMIGNANPPLTPDIGSGPWNVKPCSALAITQATGIVAAVKSGATNIYPGPNASKHMDHYFGNSGRDYTIDLEDMIRSTDRAKETMVAETRQAFRFIQQLPVGTHQFTSKFAESSYNYQSETNDWFFAIGGYSYWGKGTARISEQGGQRRYDVEFHYHFYDRYNWDGGKKVRIPVPFSDEKIIITDEFMQEFHRQGLAQEFDCYGMVQRRFSWVGDVGFPSAQQILTPGR